MYYEKNFVGQKIPIRDRYPGAFHLDRLTPNKYVGQELLKGGEISAGEKVGVFFGTDKEGIEKTHRIAKKALQSGGKVTLFYRPDWFPERWAAADDRDNSYRAEVSSEQDLERIISSVKDIEDPESIKRKISSSLTRFDPDTLAELDKSYVITPYWNRHLQGIKGISKKTIGYLGTLSKEMGTEQHYTMERYFIESVDEFRMENPHNRQILEERHINLTKPIDLLGEEQSELSGKKVLYLPEFSLEESMVARWRHEWPSQDLGRYGVRYKVRGALAPVLEKNEKGELVWKKSLLEKAKTEGRDFNDQFIGEKALEALRGEIDNADVIVFGRTSNKFLKPVFEYAKKMGKLIGYEVDDLIFGPKAIESYKQPIPGDPHGRSMAQYIEDQIKEADFVTVSTNSLLMEAALIRGGDINNIYKVSNRLHLDELRDILESEKPKRWKNEVRIGWAGSYHHIDKLLGMKDVFQKIHQKHGRRVKFVFKGLDPEKMNSSEPLRLKLEQFNSMMDGLNYESHAYTPQGDWKDYYKELKDLDLDLFMVPAKGDSEHLAKSELKYLEATLAGAATIGHAIGGHGEAITPFKNNGRLVDIGDIGSGNEDFFNSLDELIRNDNLRQVIVDNAKKDIIENYDVKKSSRELRDILLAQFRRKGVAKR